MTTALALIKTGMRQASGLLGSGQSPSTNEQTDYLALLNSFIDQCNAQRLYIYHVQQESFTWPASTASRTIGASGADFTTTRPIRIEDAYWKDSSNNEWPITIQSYDVWDRNPDKTITEERPIDLFYDTAYALGVLYLLPIPTSEGTLLLRTWKPLSSFALISTDVSFPPGYQMFLELSLARLIGRENGKALTPDLLSDLKKAEAIVKASNNKPRVMRMPPELVAGSSVYDIRRG